MDAPPKTIALASLPPSQHAQFIDFLVENEDIHLDRVSKDVWMADIELVKPPPPTKKERILQALRDVNERQRSGLPCPPYAKFCALLRLQTERPTKRSLVWLTRRIDDIYKERCDRWHAQATQRISLENIFPVFCYEHFEKCFGLNKLVDVMCWDFVYSLHAYRTTAVTVDAFARFLDETYSNEDLNFYLQVLDAARHLPAGLLTARECSSFAHQLLGSGELHSMLCETIAAADVDADTLCVRLLEVFHDSEHVLSPI